MDIRTLTKLVLKLGGIWLFVSALLSMPALFASPPEYAALGYVTIGLYFVTALVLLWFPGVVVNRLFLIRGEDVQGSVKPESLLRIGLILLGVYFTVTAAYGIVFTWASARWFYTALQPFPGSRGPDMNGDQFGSMVASAIELVAGLALWVGAPLIARVTGRFTSNDR